MPNLITAVVLPKVSTLIIDKDLDMKAYKILCDIINESSLDAGTTIEACLLKDARIGATALGILNKYTLGDTELHNNAALVSNDLTSVAKVKEIHIDYLIPSPSTIRISFELSSAGADYTAYGQIYKNGVAYGTQQSQLGTAWATFIEDLEFSQDDAIQLYITTSTGSIAAYSQNLKITGVVVPMAIAEAFHWGRVGRDMPFEGTDTL